MDKDVYTQIYTMEYYSAIKKNEILLFAMMWMEPEYNTKWTKSRKTNTTRFHSYVEFKKQSKEAKGETNQETDS